MKTTTNKENPTPSRSSQPFFNQKGEGRFFAPATEAKQPFFAPNPSIQRSTASASLSAGHNLVSTPFSPPHAKPIVQPKLTINEPGDKYEQEADAMAERVMRMESTPANQLNEEEQPIQTMPLAASSLQRQGLDEEGEPVQMMPLDIQKKCAGCEAKENEPMQKMPLMRKAENGGYTASPQLSSQLSNSKGGGTPLQGKTLSSMTQAFGADFSMVRIHTGSQAEEMSQGIEAKAFTHGSDIYFNQGQYNPDSSEGKRLLGHELTHVLQQTGLVSQKQVIQRTPSPAAEGAAQFAETNPAWSFGRTVSDHGFRMNPAFWRVTYHVRVEGGTRPITNRGSSTALDQVRRIFRRSVTVESIEINIKDGVTASVAADDLSASRSRSRYSFECFTAAALVQFVGAYRGLQQTSPVTADADFNRRYADFRVILPLSGSQTVHMDGRDLQFNLSAVLNTFTLRQLLDDPADRGIQRGDWVYLNNSSFIASGAFQGENATYLGNKRFFGHGIGVFHINEYAQRLRESLRSRIILTADQILNQVQVRPLYRAP